MTTQHLIDKTQQLITIASTSDNLPALRQAVQFMADFITQQQPDITIEWFEKNNKPSFLAYQGKTRPDTFDIILNTHVDVVPAKAEQFVPKIKNGKLFGRGALDMKGTAIVLADAFCAAINEVPYSLGLQVVCDEELGGYDCVQAQLQAGVRSNFVLIGEYANERNTIYNAARGLCWAELVFRGESAHGAHLWHGTNAVMKATKFAHDIAEYYPTPNKQTWTTTANIASITTPNLVFNRVPDKAVLKIDFRFTQEDPIFQNEESLRAFFASIDPDAELVNLGAFETAIHVSELNPYVQGLAAAMTATTEARPHFLGRPGSSDGRHYALVGSDVIEYGLYGQNSHGDDEYVEVASFTEYRAIIETFLRTPQATVTKEEPHVRTTRPHTAATTSRDANH